MRKLVFAAVSVAGVLGAATAFAADGDRSVEALAVSDPGKVVCLYMYNQGDIVRRVCQTAQYWANDHQRTRRELLEFQLRRLSSPR